jgi:hypothetical protein
MFFGCLLVIFMYVVSWLNGSLGSFLNIELFVIGLVQVAPVYVSLPRCGIK